MSDQAISPPSPAEPIVMTRDGFERLEAELAQLATVQRPAVVKQIQRATLFTDPTRAAEVANVGSFDLSMVDKQIAYLEDVLGRAEVIQSRPDAATVQPGTPVTVRYEDGTEATLTLVGPLEVDPERGHISIESPAGQTLLGKAPGADVTVGTGDEVLSLSVVAIGKPDTPTDPTPVTRDLS